MNNNEQEILTLTDREKCRLRTPVFMGSFDCRMINLNEILMNARDEVNTNFDKGEIHIQLHDDMKTITIRDTGRGIPIKGIDPSSGIRKSELIFKTLFSGGNFNNIIKTIGDDFIENCGQNGAGLTTTQYISTYFQGTQIINHQAYEVTYKDGGLEEEEREYASEHKQGTIITYSLDPKVVTNVYYTYEDILETIRRIASTTKDKIKYVFTHKEHAHIFEYETFEDYFEENFDSILPPVIHFNEKSTVFKGNRDGQEFQEGNRIEILLSLSTSPTQETYLNGGYLPEQGTFYKGIVDGLKKTFQKDVGGKARLSDNDIIMSFNIYGVMGSNNPVYSNQTKMASSSDVYRKLTSDYIISNMEVFKAENPQEFDKILKHLQQINTFNTRNEKSIKNIKKKLSEKSDTLGSRVEGLVDCRTHGENAELFITEGKSALASVIASRDADFQAGFPIRGKTLSVLKASPNQIFSNQIIIDIIKILGCGCTFKHGKKKLLDDFNISNLKYGKVIFTADRDADGDSIICLLATIFYKLMPELLYQGRVYMAKTPLYEITTKNNGLVYAFSDKERDDIVSTDNVVKIQRNKGLGELDSDTLYETTMNPETRVIEKIVINSKKDMDRYFEKWMGIDVADRKSHIEQHLHKFMKDLD